MYHNNLGNALRGAGEREPASAEYERAAAIDPTYAEAHANVGTIRRDQARFAESIASYERALALNPDLAAARGDMATVLKDQGRVEEAIAEYRRAVSRDPSLVEAHSHLLYALHASDRVTPRELYEEHVTWGKSHAKHSTAAPAPRSTPNRDPERRLRIGYVSPDFRDHPVARFLQPIVEHRDRAQFEVVCYSTGTLADAVTARWHGLADHWRDAAALDDAQLAEVVRQDHVDILVDLAGHTGSGRLLVFARRPAPVQVTYLGYPNTTGLPAMDYRITDALADPVGVADELHTEKLLRIDGCFLAYAILDELPPVAPRAGGGAITFGSFNNLAKISPTTLRLWADVLAATPGSRMIIKATSLGDPPTRELAARRFADCALPMDRVELLGPARSQEEHLATYARIDVALDTFPYNGTTTTCEALAMGVPVVSLHGSHHASRVGLSILSAAGFPEWATDDREKFVSAARGVADQAASLRSTLRERLRERLRASTLCDGRGIARKIESAYRIAWKNWISLSR
jgi:predicted O-linked N-acetylglucosamine transferase (SPINDLY family)